MQKIEEILGYKFNNTELLNLALTHSSFSINNYQRLEFVGDRVLSLLLADFMYMHTDMREGDMSRKSAYLASKEHLVSIAENLMLDDHILHRLSKQQFILARDNLLSDVLEALIGAVFIDSDYLVVKNIFLSKLVNSELLDKIEKNSKNLLQEWSQKSNINLPVYTFTMIKNDFYVVCKLEGFNDTSARASRKRQAELMAAEKMLDQINKVKINVY